MAASDPTEIPHIAAFAKGAQENDHQVDAVNVCQKKDSGYEGRYAGGLSSAGTKKRSQILKNSESDSTFCFFFGWIRGDSNGADFLFRDSEKPANPDKT